MQNKNCFNDCGTTDHSLDWRTRSKFTISEEITIFIALMMIWMSLVQTVLIRCWSTDLIYNFPFSCSRMSPNRFELLLTNLHFVTTKNIEHRIVDLEEFYHSYTYWQDNTDNYQKVFSSDQDIVIDETMILWRRWLVFRQYIPTKLCKYQIKLFKLCSTEGYIWSAKVYAEWNTSEKRKVDRWYVCTEFTAQTNC